MPQRKRINWALAGALLASGHSVKDVCKKVSSGSVNSFSVLLSRKGLRVRDLKANAVANLTADIAPNLTVRVANQASALLRESLSSELQSTHDALKTIPKTPNLKHLQKRVQVLEPLARTAKIVHGWSDETSAKPLVNVHLIGQLEPEEKIIEAIPVDAKVVSDL